jgi:hypothetical protein
MVNKVKTDIRMTTTKDIPGILCSNLIADIVVFNKDLARTTFDQIQNRNLVLMLMRLRSVL